MNCVSQDSRWCCPLRVKIVVLYLRLSYNMLKATYMGGMQCSVHHIRLMRWQKRKAILYYRVECIHGITCHRHCYYTAPFHWPILGTGFDLLLHGTFPLADSRDTVCFHASSIHCFSCVSNSNLGLWSSPEHLHQCWATWPQSQHIKSKNDN